MTHTPTSRGDVSLGLMRLLRYMKRLGRPFNAVVAAAGDDVSYLALIDNGVGWQAVNEYAGDDGEPRYDLWFRGHIDQSNLDIDAAARFLLDRYLEAKTARAVARTN